MSDNSVRATYDEVRHMVHLVCPEIPKEIIVSKPDDRGRQVYTARIWRFVPYDWERGGDGDAG